MNRRGLLLSLSLGFLLATAWLPAQQNDQSIGFPDPTTGGTLADRRRALVAQFRASSDVDQRIVSALNSVPRDQFVPGYLRNLSYEDSSLPLGDGRVLPSPSDLVRIAEAFSFAPTDRLLIYGSASGYAAALYSRLVTTVYDVELSATDRATLPSLLGSLGIGNVVVSGGDALDGFGRSAPFDAILVHGAVGTLPPGLLVQLKPGGKLIVPLQDSSGLQMLVMVQKTSPASTVQAIGNCFFGSIQPRAAQ